MTLIIIAALNTRRVIGKNGKIPWHIPEDLQRFKALTSGHTVIMGRKTLESIGAPLPHRRNIVISRDPSYRLPSTSAFADTSAELFHTIESALTAARTDEKVFVIGGGEIYRQTLDLADEIMLTLVDNDADGDIFFPEHKRLVEAHFIEEDRTVCTGHTFYHYKKA